MPSRHGSDTAPMLLRSVRASKAITAAKVKRIEAEASTAATAGVTVELKLGRLGTVEPFAGLTGVGVELPIAALQVLQITRSPFRVALPVSRSALGTPSWHKSQK